MKKAIPIILLIVSLGLAASTFFLFSGRQKIRRERWDHEKGLVELRWSMNDKVEELVNKSAETAGLLTATIEAEIEDGNTQNESVLGEIDNLTKKTAWVMEDLNFCTEQLNGIAEMDPVTGELLNPGEKKQAYRFWMYPEEGSGVEGDATSNNGRGVGMANQLNMRLTDYILLANEIQKRLDPRNPYYEVQKFEQFTPDPPAIGQALTWEYVTFHNQTVLTDLVNVERWKVEVAQVQYDLLRFAQHQLITNNPE